MLRHKKTCNFQNNYYFCVYVINVINVIMNKETRIFIWGLLLIFLGGVTFAPLLHKILTNFHIVTIFEYVRCIASIFIIFYGYNLIKKVTN